MSWRPPGWLRIAGLLLTAAVLGCEPAGDREAAAPGTSDSANARDDRGEDGTGAATAGPAEHERAIRASVERLEQAINARDTAAVAAVYAEDARFLPPGSGSVLGRDAIRAAWAEQLRAPDLYVRLDPRSVAIARSGELAYEVGNYIVLAGAPGARSEDKGKYVVVWERVGERWQIVVDIWNSDEPPR